jgi:hypothetical protein
MAKNKVTYLPFYNFSFPKGSKEYKAAYEAMDKYMKMRPLSVQAHKMNWAVRSASLHFDRHTGDLVLKEPKRNLAGLVKKEILDQISGHIKGKITDEGMEAILGKALTESAKRSLAWLKILQMLSDIKKRIDNERLLGKSDAKSKQKVDRIKLKLVALLIAKSRGGNVYSNQLGLINMFDKFWKAYNDYWYYIQLDSRTYKKIKIPRYDTIKQG